MDQRQLWDKYVEIEQRICRLKFIIQNPLTPEYPILPDFLKMCREDCDRAQDELIQVLQEINKFVCNK